MFGNCAPLRGEDLGAVREGKEEQKQAEPQFYGMSYLFVKKTPKGQILDSNSEVDHQHV